MRGLVNFIDGSTALGIMVILAAPIADAETIHVPADYPTIYQAIDAATSGDIVEVAPGIYDDFDTRSVWDGDPVSALGFLKSGVLVKSSGGAGVTTLRIDAGTGTPAVFFGDDEDCEVQGFTLTGSAANLVAVAFPVGEFSTGSLSLVDCVFRDFGSGTVKSSEYAVDARDATIEIRNCLFEQIDAPQSPSISVWGGQCTVEDSDFIECSGGGIKSIGNNLEADALTVRRSTFVNNGNEATGWGAISCDFGDAATFEDSQFYGNQTRSTEIAPALHLGMGTELGTYVLDVVVRNCTFAENSRGGGGGPEIGAHSQTIEVTGNTFYGGLEPGSALWLYTSLPSSSLVLENNVIAYFAQDQAVDSFGASVQTGCNVFWQNTGGHVFGFSLGPTDLVANPVFCGAPQLDFTVDASSPCLPWNNNGCGQIGAWGLGCGDVSVEPSSWGQIKALYR